MSYAPSLENRFWAKVPIGPAQDCWIWSGNTNGRYPVLHVNGSSCVATRLMREFMDGKPVPQGLHVCHACDNPPCVNPAHLWIGTPSDNAQDMIAKGRANYTGRALVTHCKHGHELTESNLYVSKGKRQCRLCHLARIRRRRAFPKPNGNNHRRSA
jgi:hypothetical protein